MSKVKYRVREYNPTSAQQGSHSFYAVASILFALMFALLVLAAVNYAVTTQ